MEKICVLMSTYNGAKYLRDQIDSILNQKGVKVELIVRDDGSCDETIDILNEYSRNGALRFYKGNNLGPAQSFMDLVMNAPDASYYAFADQDDVWDDDKLLVGVQSLEKYDKEPALYYSNLRIVDKNLKLFRYAHDKPAVDVNKFSSLLVNYCTGCTEVFNLNLMKILKKGKIDYLCMHDWWVYIVCSFFGKIVYDNTPHISYRQHGSNVVGMDLKCNLIKYFFIKVKRILFDKCDTRRLNALSFYNIYGNMLNSDDKAIVGKLVTYKNSFFKKMSLICDGSLKTNSCVKNFFLCVVVLLGKI